MSTSLKLEGGVSKPVSQHSVAFTAFTLFFGHQEEHMDCKKLRDEMLMWLYVSK